MVIVETHVFTKLITERLADEELRRLQLALLLRPTLGAVTPGGSGLRKVRWSQPGRGKRGGLRILYYLDADADRIYLIYVFERRRARTYQKPK
jgi:mRNA-degrading endonuclease RelE of RelBE toxin-antitoxin system